MAPVESTGRKLGKEEWLAKNLRMSKQRPGVRPHMDLQIWIVAVAPFGERCGSHRQIFLGSRVHLLYPATGG